MLSLKYGNGIVTMGAGGVSGTTKLAPLQGTPLQNPGQAFVDAASHNCAASLGLNSLVSPKDLFTILIPALPKGGSPGLILPYLTYYLTSLGVPEKNIAILVAGFNAPPQTSVGIIPPAIAQVFQTVLWNCDGEGMVSLGGTAKKTPVLVHPLLHGRRVILLDVVAPDLITGFRGGPVTVLAACGRETIQACLQQALLPSGGLSPQAASCVLTGNPIVEELLAINTLINPFFTIHLLEDPLGHLCQIVCGRWLESWYQSGTAFQQNWGTVLQASGDIVAASCGGYPQDATLESSCAGLVHACQAVKPGGTVLFTAECRDGGGKDPLLSTPEAFHEAEFQKQLMEQPTLPGLYFLSAYTHIRSHKVLLQSKINTQTLLQMGMEGFRTMETLEARVDFKNKSLYFLPDATHFYPYFC